MNKTIWNADLGNGQYQNPVLHTDYSDPDAIRVGEDYFMIASSFCNAPGLPVLHSKDLVNWEVINYVLDSVPDRRFDAPTHGCGVWAPAIRYHEGTFFACFPMPDEGIFMSTTTDPFGKWSTPVNIRPGAGWIDPCPFWDDDGKAYLVAGVAKSRIGYKSVLHMVEMQPDGMALIGEEIKIFDGNENGQVTIEGPKMYKRNGYYYLFAPAGGVKSGWQTVLRSKNIYGPYEYRVVMRQGDSAVNGPHQGAWVDTVTGEDWFLHFQDVYAAGRITHLQPMTWVDDWPVIGIAKDGNEYGEPVLVHKKPNVGDVKWDVCEPATSDDFSSDKLGLQWQWNANPKDSWYELKGKGFNANGSNEYGSNGKGSNEYGSNADNFVSNGVGEKTDNTTGNGEEITGLQLNAVNIPESTPYGDVPNLLLQKWPAPEFTCVTTVNLGQLKDGDTAGIISMGIQYGLLEIKKIAGVIELAFVQGTQKFGKILVETTDEEHIVLKKIPDDVKDFFVKYSVKRTGTQQIDGTGIDFPLETVTISYSMDGEIYEEAGSMSAVPGRWVGVKNGAFCIRKQDGEGGCLIVKSVEYTR